VKLALIIIFKLAALILLAAAAAYGGGVVTGSGSGWLLAGGLATWCLASMIESLPLRETP
jgi:hypothetical protein